ncbi:hypothetical protein J5N97_007073 [Dioscorea zingiberensis]|uniref:Uncharacterized protein n=1 Tax=Dioscorea zingiberensis TaxID=325984 RepID=A0A9D5DET2_9LILI|nr:hypothetical protein J5N97_007073 [Dioscorea zingiberensis]
MASRALNCWRSITRSKSTASAAPSHFIEESNSFIPNREWRKDFVPVYVALGMIVLSVSFGLHTAKQHVLYDPSVRVHKKRRETIPELVEPDRVINESDRLVNKSLFRRVAHLQDAGITDPTRGETINRPRRAVTLKEVGVDPGSAAALN